MRNVAVYLHTTTTHTNYDTCSVAITYLNCVHTFFLRGRYFIAVLMRIFYYARIFTLYATQSIDHKIMRELKERVKETSMRVHIQEWWCFGGGMVVALLVLGTRHSARVRQWITTNKLLKDVTSKAVVWPHPTPPIAFVGISSWLCPW